MLPVTRDRVRWQTEPVRNVLPCSQCGEYALAPTSLYGLVPARTGNRPEALCVGCYPGSSVRTLRGIDQGSSVNAIGSLQSDPSDYRECGPLETLMARESSGSYTGGPRAVRLTPTVILAFGADYACTYGDPKSECFDPSEPV
jgi:hypothetical protein